MLDHGGARPNSSDSDVSSLDEGLGIMNDKEVLKFADALNQAFFEKMEEIDKQVE